MKFSVVSNDLSKALSKIINVVPTKSTLPVLENLLFELSGNQLTLTASDLEIAMSVTLQVSGISDGRIAMPAKKLNETLRALPSKDVTISTDSGSNRITLKTDQGEYKMTGEPAGNYPETERVEEDFSLELDSSLLRTIISKTVYAVSSDDLRPSMMGVLFQWKNESFRAVATDGHRLVQIIHKGALSTAAQGDREVIIPAKALNLVLRSLDEGDVKIVFGKTNVRLTFGDLELVSRIIDERYPNYESVIPMENDKVLEINRNALLAAVNRCSIFSNAVTNQIRLTIGKEETRVSAEDIDFGGEAKEVIASTFSDGDTLEIGFNARYVTEALNHIESDEVSFYFSSATRAGLLRPSTSIEDMEILKLVMPLRLNA